MDKKVFDEFYRTGDNVYGILKTEDQEFLTTETITKVKGWFFTKDVTMGMKQLPLSAAVYALMADFLETPVIREDDLGGEALETEIIYDEVDVKATRKMLRQMAKEAKEASGGLEGRFNYAKSTKNEVVRKFMEDGNQLLCVETLSPRVEQVYLAKSDQFGTLTIHKCFMHGKGEKAKLLYMETFVYNKPIVEALFKKIMGGN